MKIFIYLTHSRSKSLLYFPPKTENFFGIPDKIKREHLTEMN